VYGPIAPQSTHQESVGGAVSVVIKYGRGGGGNTTTTGNSSVANMHEYGRFVQQVLRSCIDWTPFPRCVVQVTLQVIQSDGSLLGSLLHAAVAALLDAGIDLLYVPVATTCLVDSNSPYSSIVLDPTSTEEEEDKDTSVVVLVNDPSTDHDGHDKVLGTYTIGPGISLDELLSCVQIANKASPAVTAFVRLAMEQKIIRESKTLWSR
jgi:ribonuclease PH